MVIFEKSYLKTGKKLRRSLYDNDLAVLGPNSDKSGLSHCLKVTIKLSYKQLESAQGWIAQPDARREGGTGRREGYG